MRPSDYHPFSPAVRENPYPYYAVLREEAPLFALAERPKAQVVSRYEDVAFALKNPALFSSESMRTAQRVAQETGKLDDELRRANAARNLISADPPVHTRLRNLVNRAFTPRRVADLEPRIRALAQTLIRAFLDKGEVDFIRELATPLPVTVIAHLLGIENERLEDFKRWSDVVVASLALLVAGGGAAPLSQSFREMREYMEGFIAQRRQKPQDDLISALVEGGDREGLSNDEIVGFCRLLLIAGNETTTNLLGNCMRALVRFPEELARLGADRSLVPNTVEEALRYDSPVQGLFRTATQDVTLTGGTVKAGEQALLLLGSANRDPRRFPEPDRFQLTRDTQGTLSFGYGIHFCLGAPLARLEAKVVLEELFDVVRDVSLAPSQPERVEMLDSLTLRGPKSLRLRFERA